MRGRIGIAGMTAFAMAAPANAAMLMLDPATGPVPFQMNTPPTWDIYQRGTYPFGGQPPTEAGLLSATPEPEMGQNRRRWPPPSEAPEIAAEAAEANRSGGWLPLIGGVLLVAYRMRRARGRTRFTSAV